MEDESERLALQWVVRFLKIAARALAAASSADDLPAARAALDAIETKISIDLLAERKKFIARGWSVERLMEIAVTVSETLLEAKKTIGDRAPPH